MLHGILVGTVGIIGFMFACSAVLAAYDFYKKAMNKLISWGYRPMFPSKDKQ